MKMKLNNILCFLSVLLALLLVSAAVDTSADEKDVKKQEVKAAPVEDAKDEGGGGDWGRGCGRRCRYGCCGGSSDNCGCRRCCAPNEYAMVKEPGKVEDTKSGGGGDHGCRPCCYRGGCRCCAENEVPIDNNNNNNNNNKP